ncbi:uncharacterized protein LOC130138945 [Syzygium oleosum]|uniref:uncharacterized protein LOC130138945 n=1 Tax=Syzygium oleosum TaxID=219896 RepID=UPI0024B953FB|nr:uncharacterized protein LOC130138945 [Syzygium oleosum]
MEASSVDPIGSAADNQLYNKFQNFETRTESYNLYNLGNSNKSLVQVIRLLRSNSPRILMASLQHGFRRLPPQWKGMARRYDSAAEETVRERRAAIESGRLKGRRLFEMLDSGDGEAEICSGWSGVTDDDDDSDDDDDVVCCGKIKMSEEVVAVEDGGYCASLSSSSSSPGIGEIKKKRKMVRGLITGRRWIGIVSVLLAVAIVAMRSCASGHGSDGHMNLVPT